MDLAVDNYNQTVEWGGRARPFGSSRRTRTTCRAYGLSLDGGYGFPVMEELCETLMVGTASGHYRAAIAKESDECA